MQNLLKSHLMNKCRDSLKKTERLILEEGTRGILEAWTLFLWEIAEDLSDTEDSMEVVEVRLKNKEDDSQREECLLEEVERQKELICQLEEALREANSKLVLEVEKSFDEGIKVGRDIAAIEELGVIEELEILKNIKSILTNGTNICKENILQEENFIVSSPINHES